MARKVVVIGSGLAGTAAAVSAKKAGADVTLITGRNGASTFWSGALDLAGDPHPPLGKPEKISLHTKTNLEKIIDSNRQHPYAVISDGDPSKFVTALKQGIELLFPADCSITLSGNGNENIGCFTSLGTIKYTGYAIEGIAELNSDGIGKPLVVGINRLLDFDPQMWTKIAKDNTEKLGLELDPETAFIQIGASKDRRTIELANEIATSPDQLVSEIKKAVDMASGAKSVVLPQVLPMKNRIETIDTLKQDIPVPVYETLSLPPSVAGLRLSKHMSSRLAEIDVDTINGIVNSIEEAGGRIKSISVADEKIVADSFVLASGKFLGGGLEKDAEIRETVFGLPVFAGDRVVDEIFVGKLLGLQVNQRHELFEVGVKINKDLKPLLEDGAPAYDNLYAAGSVIGGYNPINGSEGAGTAIATGIAAGVASSR